jgi:hypothetical protein
MFMSPLAFRLPLTLALAGAVLAVAPVYAADPAAAHPAPRADGTPAEAMVAQAGSTPAASSGDSSTSSTDAASTATRMQTLRDRMQQMRRTRDPATRMRLMEEHMAQMESVMKDVDANCPMAGAGGPGMMGRGMGGGMGMHGDAMLLKRIDSLEKRVDMLQLLFPAPLVTHSGRGWRWRNPATGAPFRWPGPGD